MIYLVCFCITLSLLLFVVAYEKAIDVNIILLMAVVATGNGGYYALTCSHNLEEAILANNMSYVIAIFLTISIAVILIPLIKISVFSLHSNQNLLEYKLNKIGYIAFDKRLKFMGCNDYAKKLFPELETWELEKKIPAGGAKFNTFLRQPL